MNVISMYTHVCAEVILRVHRYTRRRIRRIDKLAGS